MPLSLGRSCRNKVQVDVNIIVQQMAVMHEPCGCMATYTHCGYIHELHVFFSSLVNEA